MRVLIGSVWVVLCTALPAAALTFEACTKTERGIIIAALERAERLTLTAATAVGPTPVYQRWFGKYDPSRGETVRRNLKAVVSAMRKEGVHAVCTPNGIGLCEDDTYAFVDPDEPYDVMLCDSFFVMETMKDLSADSVAKGNGTRAGTLVHEITHFSVVASTDDICYSREDCTDMAIDAPLDALMNADSYQYFVEDVTYFGVAGE